MKIEERASLAYPNILKEKQITIGENTLSAARRNSYIFGAEDQKKIDIENVCRLLDETLILNVNAKKKFIDRFRKQLNTLYD